MKIHDRIRTAREAKGLSKAELARRLKLSRTTITQWESGETAPSRRHIEDVARELAWPLSALDPLQTTGLVSVDPTGIVVPIIDWGDLMLVEKTSHKQKITNAVKGKPKTLIGASDLPPDTQALQIIDDSMTPIVGDVGGLTVGDAILISKSLPPMTNCLVVASVDGGHPIVRQFVSRSPTAFDLVATNPEYKTETCNKSRPGAILAVVIEHRRRLFTAKPS